MPVIKTTTIDQKDFAQEQSAPSTATSASANNNGDREQIVAKNYIDDLFMSIDMDIKRQEQMYVGATNDSKNAKIIDTKVSIKER